MEERRKIHQELEVVQEGYANGVAPGFPFTDKEKLKIISNAEKAYGKFLDALKCDWRNDPNSKKITFKLKTNKKSIWQQAKEKEEEVRSLMEQLRRCQSQQRQDCSSQLEGSPDL